MKNIFLFLAIFYFPVTAFSEGSVNPSTLNTFSENGYGCPNNISLSSLATCVQQRMQAAWGTANYLIHPGTGVEPTVIGQNYIWSFPRDYLLSGVVYPQSPLGDGFQLYSSVTQCPDYTTTMSPPCTCSVGYAPSVDSKTCVMGPHQDTALCPLTPLGAVGFYNVSTANGSPPIHTCKDGCQLVYDGSSGSASAIELGILKYYAIGAYDPDGWTCTVGAGNSLPTSISNLPKDSCPVGEIYIENAFGFYCSNPPVAASGISATGTTAHPFSASAVPEVSTTIGTSTTVTNPDGSTTTTSSSSTFIPPVQFPSDYAKSGEAVSAANLINPKLDTLHTDLTATTSVADPVAVDSASMPSMTSTFTSLKNWSLPAHTSTCPAPSIDLSGVLGAGRVFQFSAHCQLVQNHFAALQAAMMVSWTMMALFVVLRA